MDGLDNHEKMAEEILNYLNEGIKGVNEMFDPQKMAQTVVNLTKDYTTTTMQVMKTSLEHYEKTMDTLMKQGNVVQEEGQKLWADWMNKAKQGQQQYWSMMNENINKMTALFSPDGEKRATK